MRLPLACAYEAEQEGMKRLFDNTILTYSTSNDNLKGEAATDCVRYSLSCSAFQVIWMTG